MKLAISCAKTVPSSTSVHGRHMQSIGARVRTFFSLGSPGRALGQLRVMAASRSPDSWQHMHDLSVCHSLLPDTCMEGKRRRLIHGYCQSVPYCFYLEEGNSLSKPQLRKDLKETITEMIKSKREFKPSSRSALILPS